MSIRRARMPVGLASLLLLAACATEVSGPEPQLSVANGEALTSPSFACNEQLDSWITLRGANFSPLVIDTIDKENDFSIDLPKIRLIQRSGVDGEAVSNFSITLESFDGVEGGDLRWISDDEMQFRVRPDQALPPGVYDLEVENANGGITLTESAFGVLPRPTVTGVLADLTCLAQGERGSVIQGSDFLVEGTERPTVLVEGERYTVTQADGCRRLPAIFGNYELCDALYITIGQDQHEPGAHAVTVENIDPAGCSSLHAEDALNLVVVAPPTVTEVTPVPVCGEQLDYEVRVAGEGFVVVEGPQGDVQPTVSLGELSYVPTRMEGCAAIEFAVQPSGRSCTTAYISVSAGELAAVVAAGADFGRTRVKVENPEPVGCHSTEAIDMTVVPPPTVAAITSPVCTTQYDNVLTITGHGFLRIAGALPQVRIGASLYDVDALEDCTAIDNITTATDSCRTAMFTLPEGDFTEAGNYPVVVINPETAQCESTQEVDLTVVAAPVVELIGSPMCTAQFENTLTLTGQGFLGIGEALPQVRVGETLYDVNSLEGCEDIEGLDASVQSCTTANVTIAEGDLADVGDYTIVLINPETAQCESTESVELTVVPPPTVTALTPQPLCTAQGENIVTVTGTDFLIIDGNLPTIYLGMDSYEAMSADGCETVTIQGDVAAVETCTSLEFTIGQGDFIDGSQTVIVTNPTPAACSSMEEIDVKFVEPPTLATIAESFACIEAGGRDFTITGEGFIAVDDELPAILVGNLAFASSAVTGCIAIEIDGVDARECTSLTFNIGEGDLVTGLYGITVLNPVPAACESSNSLELFIAGAPVIASADPVAFCDGAGFDGDVVLTGEYFLVIDGVNPTIDVNGTVIATTTTADCEPIANPTNTISACKEISFNVPDGLRDVDLTVTASNPGPANCGSSSVEIIADASPVVASVTPQRICTAGGTLQLDGSNYNDGLRVFLGGREATEVVVTNEGTRAVATFAAGLPFGLHTLSVANPSGCSDSFETEIRAVDGPLPFYVDPEVTWNGMSTQVTIYASGLFGGTVAEVYLIDADDNELLLESSFDANRPNTVQAIIPEGILPEGETSGNYRFRLIDDVDCSNRSSEDLLTIVDELTVAVDAIIAPFGHTGASTSVTITGFDPAPTGQVQFVATPRVYLSPIIDPLNPPAEAPLARELSSLRYIDATELGGIVPEGLEVGFYEVIVINPDGTVGLAAEPFQVTAEPPPLVDSVSPGAWNRGVTNLAVLVTGQNFRNPSVSVECFGDNVTTPGRLDVDSFTETTINITVDTNNLELLSICVMRVTNTDDGTYADYSPIAITNPNANSANFLRFRATTDLIEARRGLVSFGGVPAREARYIYAVGGDDGTTAGAKTTGEFAALDRLGAPQEWNYLPYDLPAGRTLSTALRLDDFVYLAGGHDGEAVTDAVWRAQVLNPLEVPRITNVEIDFIYDESEEPPGLAPGVYYYRVAAMYGATDPVNPEGESLASDPQAVRVPNLDGVVLSLSWTAPPIDNGIITAYRVYRSLSADSPYGDESLIGTVVPGPGLLTFVDDGTIAIDDTIQPLPLGALGQWHPVAEFNIPRYSHGLASAVDPLDPTVRYIYAAGGRNAGDVLLNDNEFLTVTTEGPRKQTVSALATVGDSTFTGPRANFALLAANPENANRLDRTFLFAMHSGGTNRIDVAEVLAGGLLNPWSAPASGSAPGGESRTGYAAAVANNQFFLVGGGDIAKKNSLNCGTPCTLPSIQPSWTASAQSDATNRILGGYLASRGFIYTLAGNVDGTLTRTTEYSILGGTP